MNRRNPAGFTLLETLISLFLVLCLLWGILPRYQAYFRRRETVQAVSLFRNTLILARQQAITRRQKMEVFICPQNNTLRVRSWEDGVMSGKEERLPEVIQIVAITESIQPLVFRPDGGLAGISGSITFKNRRTGEHKRMIVYGITGRVRVGEAK